MRGRKLTLLGVRNEQGQLTLFFAFTTLVLVSALAFIVNVGLFVKAKINLQNAVDAAAWSGAAVQARQLSKIGYLNWEMRNIYKEWMYKYYILGQLSNTKLWTAGGDSVDFRLPNFDAAETEYDRFNIPSVCIHFSGTTNICSVYSVPGLPRFEDIQIPGYAETTKAFIDTLVSSKGKDCNLRAQLNYAVNHAWAFGVDESTTSIENLPVVATDRLGAWPRAFELAIRVRNLEKLVNTPPITSGVCDGDCSTDIRSLAQTNPNIPPAYERTIKAYLAAKKNLGSEADMYNSFKLFELAPQAIDLSDTTSLNRILYGNNENEKYYLDLYINLVNLATFYTLFVPVTGSFSGVDAPLEAQCAGSKMATPVPLYPLGFIKNPSVLTYYAVKGTAEFVGLFNPFTNNGVVTLEAYAAAKPFGGRIGPMIYATNSTGNAIRPRETGRSAPYISALDVGYANTFKEGFPLPISSDFWVKGSGDKVGGWPESESDPITFGIPNLLYDITSKMDGQSGGGADSIQIIKDEGRPDPTNPSALVAGLYSRDQYQAFAGSIDPASASSDTVRLGINRMKQPTKYEALNYLIPNIEHSEDLDAMGVVAKVGGNGTDTSPYTYQILAPLWGENTLFQDQADVVNALEEFLTISDQAVSAYVDSLKQTASTVYSTNKLYRDAALGLHDKFDSTDTPTPSCTSLAGKYYHFFTGLGNGTCTSTLRDAMGNYFSNKSDDGAFSTFYIGEFVEPASSDLTLSAFAPGTNQGGNMDGTVTHPWTKETTDYRRNFYSTKLISLKSVDGEVGDNGYGVTNFTLFSEGDTQIPRDIAGDFSTIRNPISTGQVPDSILH